LAATKASSAHTHSSSHLAKAKADKEAEGFPSISGPLDTSSPLAGTSLEAKLVGQADSDDSVAVDASTTPTAPIKSASTTSSGSNGASSWLAKAKSTLNETLSSPLDDAGKVSQPANSIKDLMAETAPRAKDAHAATATSNAHSLPLSSGMIAKPNSETKPASTDTSPPPKNLYSIFSKTPSKSPTLTALGKTRAAPTRDSSSYMQ